MFIMEKPIINVRKLKTCYRNRCVMNKITTGLNTIGDMVVDALAFEFSQQGHNNTGAGIESIVYAVKQFGNVYQLDLSFNKYMIYQDKGITADRIPFSFGSGNKTSKYIAGLTKWVMQRGMANNRKKARSIAFAIAKTHKKEGMPTRGSYLYSRNGRRKNFFTENYVFEKVPQAVEQLMTTWATAMLEDIINDTRKYISTTKKIAA